MNNLAVWITIILNIIGTIAAIGIAWGIFTTKLANAEKELEKKLDLAVFELHKQGDDKRFDRLEIALSDINKKLDRLIERNA
jgi:hypothetical protein